MRRSFAILAVLVLFTFSVSKAQTNHTESRGGKRTGKLFSFVSVIRFPNDGCSGSNNVSGTCYTADECSKKSGTSGGSCAQGYGVCCVFSLGCGQTTAQNCTYFKSGSPVTAGMCTLTVCKASSNICQLRLDFSSFTLAPPSAGGLAIGKLLNGQLQPLPAAPGVSVNTNTECLTDSFSVTNPDGSAPPTICGSNAMQHMYVEASDACNNLVFQIGTTTSTTRQWNIKITQYSCDYSNLAPAGCVQYFFDPSGTGTVTSFNFNGGQHLANQQQSICVRRESSNCRICWWATIAAGMSDFALSGTIASMGLDNPAVCCQYSSGNLANGFDCVSIPSASKQGGTRIGSRFCGQGAGLVTSAPTGGTPSSVCSTRLPFLLNFFSDNYEYTTEIEPQVGFSLVYKQSSTMCP